MNANHYLTEYVYIAVKIDADLVPVKRYVPQMKLLVDPSMKYWVHHTSYITKMGRVLPWKPAATVVSSSKTPTSDRLRGESEESDTEYEGEGAEEEMSGYKPIVKEKIPPLLNSIGDDVSFDERPSWTLMTSATIFPEFQVVGVRSNNWPGASAFCNIR